MSEREQTDAGTVYENSILEAYLKTPVQVDSSIYSALGSQDQATSPYPNSPISRVPAPNSSVEANPYIPVVQPIEYPASVSNNNNASPLVNQNLATSGAPQASANNQTANLPAGSTATKTNPATSSATKTSSTTTATTPTSTSTTKVKSSADGSSKTTTTSTSEKTVSDAPKDTKPKKKDEKQDLRQKIHHLFHRHPDPAAEAAWQEHHARKKALKDEKDNKKYDEELKKDLDEINKRKLPPKGKTAASTPVPQPETKETKTTTATAAPGQSAPTPAKPSSTPAQPSGSGAPLQQPSHAASQTELTGKPAEAFGQTSAAPHQSSAASGQPTYANQNSAVFGQPTQSDSTFGLSPYQSSAASGQPTYATQSSAAFGQPTYADQSSLPSWPSTFATPNSAPFDPAQSLNPFDQPTYAPIQSQSTELQQQQQAFQDAQLDKAPIQSPVNAAGSAEV